VDNSKETHPRKHPQRNIETMFLWLCFCEKHSFFGEKADLSTFIFPREPELISFFGIHFHMNI
ncbi:hypothetical protein R0K17_25825, partial [Planococcus sp. SIMBA_143]